MKKFFATLILTCLLLNCLAFLPACTGTVKLLYEEIEADGEIIAYSVVGVRNNKAEFDITIPSTYNEKPVVSIKDSAFKENKLLKSIYIAETISTIELDAFLGCSSLTNIMVDENNNYYKSIDGNLYDKDETEIIQYAIGSTETNFIIPEGVNVINNGCFLNAIYLTDVIIPDSMCEIGAFAFASCSLLKTVTIGKNVGVIILAAFFGCNSLENVFFKGSKEEWENISIGENNTCLTGATIHYSL